MHFRQHQFAVSADVEGMLLQVGVTPCDQPSLHFLWREDATSLQYTRHISVLGTHQRARILHFSKPPKLTLKFFEKHLEQSLLGTRLYMDDYLDSFENRKDAMRASKDLVRLLELGDFRHTKFVSNFPAIG